MNDQPPMPPRQTQGRGCLFYGCLTLIVLFVVVGFTGYLGYRKLSSFVDQFASKEPMELAPVHFTEEQKARMQLRLREFADGLQTGAPGKPLTFDGDDLNLLLASSEKFRRLADHVRLRIEDGEVKGQVSLRFGDLGAPVFQDRYLNGEGSFKVSLREGHLVVSPSEMSVNGKPLPEKYLAAIQQENLAQAANDDPDVAATLEKLETIEVEESALKVVPK